VEGQAPLAEVEAYNQNSLAACSAEQPKAQPDSMEEGAAAGSTLAVWMAGQALSGEAGGEDDSSSDRRSGCR